MGLFSQSHLNERHHRLRDYTCFAFPQNCGICTIWIGSYYAKILRIDHCHWRLCIALSIAAVHVQKQNFPQGLSL